ncbi:MAG: hypothetical protein ACSLEW_07160 [Nocardioides sp.]
MEPSPVLQGAPPSEPDPAGSRASGSTDARWYGRIVVAFVAGIVVGLVASFLWGKVSDFRDRVQDPMAYVSTVDDEFLGRADPQVTSTRLQGATGENWQLRYFMDDEEFFDVEPLEKSLPELRSQLVVPDLRLNNVDAIYTNVFSDESVARNGYLYMLKFDLPPQVGKYLRPHPRGFVDDQINDAADAYWVGGWAVYYSSVGAAQDWTEELRPFLKEWAWCANRLGPCTPGEEIESFDAWAPRGAV